LKSEVSVSLLEACGVNREEIDTLRLASLPRREVASTLYERGVKFENIRESISVLEELRQFMTAEQFVEASFRPRTGASTPFRVGRFSSGLFPVYYSALEEKTCRCEVEHYFRQEIDNEPGPTTEHSRTYNLVHCRFRGTVADLFEIEEQHPELTSETQEGYPFCQRIGDEAVETGVQALLTPSARNPRGRCLPVLDRITLSDATVGKMLVLHVSEHEISFRESET